MLNAWVTCARTQWRHAGMDGRRVGLDYTAVLRTLEHVHPRGVKRLFAGICTLESALLACDAEAAAARQQDTANEHPH